MVKILDSYGEIDVEQLTEFEERVMKLPESYKSFLLKNNGGRCVPRGFVISEEQGLDSVNRFFGIHSGKYNNLEKNINRYRNRIPKEFITIGSDSGGNMICLGIKGYYLNKIYFWNHEDELDKKGESKTDMSNMYYLADTINEFLGKLVKTDEEDIED